MSKKQSIGIKVDKGIVTKEFGCRNRDEFQQGNQAEIIPGDEPFIADLPQVRKLTQGRLINSFTFNLQNVRLLQTDWVKLFMNDP